MSVSGQHKFSVLMVGCGNMGAAIAAGMAAQMPTTSIVAVDPHPQKARQQLSSFGNVTVMSDLADIAPRKFEICILATKPQYVVEAMRLARSYLSDDAVIISIAAGTPLSIIADAAPDLQRFVRVMPNLPALASSGMSVGFARQGMITDLDKDAIEAIFTAIGHFCWLKSEVEIDLATGITGSGPGYVFAFVEHLQKAAEKMGFAPEMAEQFARQTLIGSAKVLEQDQRAAHDLKVAVTSPGGTTAAGLEILEAAHALPSLLIETTAAAARRAAELAHNQ